MIATYVPGSDSITADGRTHESVPFLATCPKCKIRQPQDEYNRAALLTLLSHGHSIEAYCPECDEFWSISAYERARLASALGTQFSG
jgi:hypothetical protein